MTRYIACVSLFLIAVVNGIAVNTKRADSLQILADRSDDTSKVRFVNEVAAFFLKNNNVDSALVYAKKAIELQSRFIYPKQHLISYTILSDIFLLKRDINSSLEYCLKGFKLAEQYNDYEFKYSFSKKAASNYLRKEESEQALNYLLKSLSFAEQKNDTSKILSSYSTIGNFYTHIKNLDIALLFYRKYLGIVLIQHISDSASFYLGIGTAYSNIGLIMIRHYGSNLKLTTYRDSALFYFNKGLEAIRKTKDSKMLCILLINSSDACNNMRYYNKAIDLLMEASPIAVKMDDPMLEIIVKINLGDAYSGLNEKEIAVQYLSQAIDSAKKYNLKEGISEAYLSLSKTYEKSNSFDQAFYCYKQYTIYKDSILNAQNASVLSEMTTKYETEKNEAKIKLLTKDNELKQHELGKQKSIRNIISAGLLSIVLLLFLLFGRYRITKELNKKLDKTNLLINNKNNLIMDSIVYAERIQRAVLPSSEALLSDFSDSFVVYIPKDIIGGDIYWFTKRNNSFLLAAVDCTGHGVPGALMSMVAYNLLNRSVKTNEMPDVVSVINIINQGLQNFVSQNIDKTHVRDGMDISLCSIDLKTLKLNFAGAQNSVYIVRNKELTELKGDPVSLGDITYSDHAFSIKTMNLQKGDWLYFFTDGYADQKGGSQNKKLYYQPFRELIIELSDLPGPAQKQKLVDKFHQWKGENGQVDDVLIFGVKI